MNIIVVLSFLLGIFEITLCSEKNWWKSTEIYEVYIRSFKDSNGDGSGDLKGDMIRINILSATEGVGEAKDNGITAHLDHFTDLQINTIWLSPFLKSPQHDMGYDISDYRDIDPMYGTMEDFRELVFEAKKRDIKIIMDFVINHSSDEHIWFQKSIDRIQPYDSYYVWKNAKTYDPNGTPIPPSNWVSLFGGSAWEWNDKRKQFYLHHFGKKQPDLNLKNDKVKREIKELIEFWLDEGVNGLRMDAVPQYIEDDDLRDEPLKNPHVKKDIHLWFDYDHIYTENIPENYKFVRELREYIDDINMKKGGLERIMLTEIFATFDKTMKYYGTETSPMTHTTFNYFFVRTRGHNNATSIHNALTEWINNVPKYASSCWAGESHDIPRIDSRLSPEFSSILNAFLMLLPGMAGIYYGQEICMRTGLVRPDQQYSESIGAGFTFRDTERTPMQWDDSINAGFSSKRKPWLPVNPNYWSLNLAKQKMENNSCYSIFKELSRLRKTKTGKNGDFNSYVLSTWVYAFTRTLKGYDTYVVIVNLGTELEMVNLHRDIGNLRTFLKVLVASSNAGYKSGDIVKVKSKFPHLFVMRPLSFVVLSSPSKSTGTSENIDWS